MLGNITELPDKLGVYRVGNMKFYSKLEAIEMHVKTGIHPHWDFNEAVYSSCDWTREPTKSIKELYRDRAIQLREKYDYIILHFSGGADSTNILQTFLENNIKLDEIVSHCVDSVATKSKNYFNDEVTKVAWPMVEKLKEQYPWLKSVQHRFLEHSEFIEDYFAHRHNCDDWFYETNMIWTPNHVARNHNLALKVPEWADLLHAGKKICMLYGQDKPRIIHENNCFGFRFIDFIGNVISVKSMAGQYPWTDELFYWSPDMPEICIKQAHLIKNYLKLDNVEQLPHVSKVSSDLAYKVVKGTKYWLSNHGVHQLIYPNWDINTFSVGKPSSSVLSPRDYWVTNLEEDNVIKKNWVAGIEKMSNLVCDYWKNDVNNFFEKGIKASWSKIYYLEKGEL